MLFLKDHLHADCRWLAVIIVVATCSSAAAQREAGPGVLPPPSAMHRSGAEELQLSPAQGEPQPALGQSKQEGLLPDELLPAPQAAESLPPPNLAEQVPLAPPLEDPTDPQRMDLIITPTPSWYDLAYWFGPDPWEGHVELGLNGSRGNNEVLSMRAGGHLKRKTKRWKFASDLQYNRNVSNGVETQNNAKLDVRLDRVFGDSRWTTFFLNNLIYDEFQAFDVQLSLSMGTGYKIYDNEIIDLLARFGAGTTREFGGPDDTWAPNALLGVDYEHHITATQRLTAKIEYYPQWDDFNSYRVVSDTGWEIDLDKPKNVSLKFSVVDRYDSTPNGRDPNTLNYAMLLIWGL